MTTDAGVVRSIPGGATLLWVARYWPVIGGSELHSRRLAQVLAEDRQVGVLTHSQKAAAALEQEAVSNRPQHVPDGRTVIHRPGLDGWRQKLLQCLARCHHRYRIVRPLYAFLFRRVFATQCLAIASRYELVHVIYNGLTESAELAAATASRLGIPFVLTPLCCTSDDPANTWSSRRFRRLYQQASAIIALTEHEKNWLIQRAGAPADRVHVCPMGPMVEIPSARDFRSEMAIGDKPLVLYLGRVTVAKGLKALLDAANRVWKQSPDVRFLLLGPPDEEARALLAQHSDHRLLTLAAFNQADKCAALQTCDLLCLPSRAESLGVVILEAWCHARPVVAVDLPVLHEVIDHGVDGLLVGADPDGLAAALGQLLADKQQRWRMGQAGQAKVLRRYSWSSIGSQISTLYASVLGSANARRSFDASTRAA